MQNHYSGHMNVASGIRFALEIAIEVGVRFRLRATFDEHGVSYFIVHLERTWMLPADSHVARSTSPESVMFG